MEVEVDITREDYAHFNVYWYKKSFNKRMQIYVLLAIAFYIYLFYSSGFTINSIIAVLITSCFLVLMYFGLLKWIAYKASKVPSEKGIVLGKRKITLTEDSICEESSLSKGTIKWAALKSLDEDEKMIFIFLETNAAFLIPKRSFLHDNDSVKFVGFINQKLAMNKTTK